VVQYKEVQVKIKDVVFGVQNMLKDLDKKMHALSGGKPVKYTIPKEHSDDLSSTGRGGSWLEAAYTEPREQGLMHGMVSQNVWNLSYAEGGRLKWNLTACRDFMRKAGDIVDLIVSLVHMGSGPPLRGEEIIRDQITNGVQRRTIYLVFGQIMAIRRHSKNTNVKGMDAFNVCYFPKSLTDSISYYLLVVRPLERLVATVLYQNQDTPAENYNLFLYVKEGKRMTSSDLSTTLGKVCLQYIGTSLSIQPLRHILIAFQRAYVEELRVPRWNNIGDLISSHSSHIADAHYAVEHGQPEGYTAEYLLNVQEWCDDYHDAIGLGDRNIPLVPLRAIRRNARRLGSVTSGVGCANPPAPVPEGLVSLVREITAVAHKLAMEDIKPFLTNELQTAVANATKYLFTAQSTSSCSDTLEQHCESSSTNPSQVESRVTKPLPSRAQPGSLSQVGDGGRRMKRGLSTGEQSQAKRLSTTRTAVGPSSSFQTHPTKGVDAQNMTAFEFEDPATPTAEVEYPTIPIVDLENPTTLITEIEAAATSATVLKEATIGANIHPLTTITTPASGTEVTLARFSSMSLEPRRTEGQASFEPEPTRTKSALRALQKLRKDPLAKFKSDKQRELVECVLDGRHTICVLPTGGGKSLAYELPPICRDQVTIAVFPFRVLLAQAAEACSRRGVPYRQWNTTTVRDLKDVRLVIMSIETLLSHEILE
jgi:hypothetical protein